ncbi:MAG TPA: FG-GAP-like repeat-containing protein [Bacteroidales bacterium]|nr:FG-GAP-like repeat-containing protein [Bacteroidales bacterium]
MKKPLLKLCSAFLILIATSSSLFSQAFTESAIPFPNLSESSAAWGDYDGDNDLDLAISNMSKTYIYRNDITAFTDMSTSIIIDGVSGGAVKWADYDNDGDLDLAMAGYSLTSGNILKIYRNDAGSFTDIAAGLPGFNTASLDWNDYDSDGDPDILVSGYTGSAYVTRIYVNENGIFTDINAVLAGCTYGSSVFSDLDADGDLDLIIAGYSASGYITKIYRNDSGTFREVNTQIPGFAWCSVSVGDIDNDGDKDIFISGTSTGYDSRIFRNDNWVFTDLNATLLKVDSGENALADLDNDGDLDLVISGFTYDGSIVAKAYLNDGGGTFTEMSFTFTGVVNGAIVPGDYNKDSKLDLFFTGNTQSGSPSKLYVNNTTNANTAPTVPTGLTTSTGTTQVTGVTLSWNKSSDNKTPADALTYNVYIGTSLGAVNKKSPGANTSTGYRRVAQSGDIVTNSWTIKKLPQGTYYWSVQAIDNSYAGSAFATQGSFTVAFSSTIAPAADQTILKNQGSATLTVTESSAASSRQWKYSTSNGGPYDQLVTGATGLTCSPSFANTGVYYVVCESSKGGITYLSNPVKIIVSDFQVQNGITLTGLQYSSSAWGDYDNDGDLDLLMSGYDGTTYVTNIYRNNLGAFTNIGAGLPGLTRATVSWGDYDNDGDLDILLTGGYATVIFKNNGNNTFTDIAAPLQGIYDGTADWGDYDNDGDLDIFLSGRTSSAIIVSIIYRNDKTTFTDIKAGIATASSPSAAWGDYDADNDLDLLYSGNSGTKVYRNDNGKFTDINAGLTSATSPSVTWGDYDNDGDLDILIAATNYTKILKNEQGIFTDLIAGLPALSNPAAGWGDYDNDGDLDIVIAGSGFTYVYRNDSGIYSEITASFTGINDGSASWGDYEGDGDIDLIVSGKTTTEYTAKIYKNNSSPNTVPSAPANLKYTIQGNSVLFQWDPSTDQTTPAKGLSYNIYIGSSTGKTDLRSPMANISDGYRRIVQKGNPSSSYRINSLPSGTYFWSVQAIDNSFAGSAFATENKLIIPYSSSIAPLTEQILVINQSGTALTVTESSTPNSRQWKYSTTQGGPYTNTITGANGTSWTPLFQDWGTYYVVCESVKDGVTYTSNEVRINIPVLSEVTGNGLANITNRYATAGDYDNDGDLDLLVGMGGSNRLFRNDGTAFVEVIPAFRSKSAYQGKWGDYDNDGDLDVLLVGSGSYIFRNDGAAFTEIAAGLYGASSYSQCAWFDYDVDGDLDVIYTTDTDTKIFRNDNSVFNEVSSGIAGITSGALDCGDFDNDGDPDILICGYSDNVYIAAVYRNNSGVFRNINAALPGMYYYSSAVWGDYDNDGDLDIALAGTGFSNQNTSSNLAKIFRNDNGIFADINANLTGIYNSNVSFADYDNDGDLDLLVSGSTSSNVYSTKIYRNDNSVFTDINAGLPGLRFASAAWGDYDKDNDLDLILAGTKQDGFGYVSLFKNNITVPNAKPSSPFGLSAVNTGKIDLSWSKSSDSKTPQAGLTYNVYISTVSGAVNKKSPMAGLPIGTRKITARGPEQRNAYSVKNLPAGTYYWSVQAIDNSFAGSDFAAESSFSVPFSLSISPLADQLINPGTSGTTLTVTESAIPASRQWKYSTVPGGLYTNFAGQNAPTFTPSYSSFPSYGTYYVVCTSVYNSITYTSQEVKIRPRLFSESLSSGFKDCALAIGDYDNDGDLDLLVSGSEPTGNKTFIFKNGLIPTEVDAGFIKVSYGSADWGDYDNDGDLDLVLSGSTNEGTSVTKVYSNNAGVFTSVADLYGVSSGSTSWGDYDNDGDLDILVTGSDFADIYRNEAGIFTRINTALPGVTESSSAFGDYDNDGDLDVVISGNSGYEVVTRIYRNDNGTFTDINAGLTGVSYSSVEWGDYDSDGDIDLLLTGLPGIAPYGGTTPVTKVYRNSNGTFTDINATLQGVYEGKATWGDYDIDGDLDILVAGSTSVDPLTTVYRNDNGTFNKITEELSGIMNGTASWYDMDNDSDLDICLVGRSKSGTIGGMAENLIINTTSSLTVANTPPVAPTNLQASLSTNKVTLSWNKTTDSKTAQNGLTYNIYLGTIAATGNKLSPMSAIPGGYRRIVKSGTSMNSIYIKNLPAGTYYWSVQAIDNNFAGSAFATGSSFSVLYSNSVSPAADQTVIVNQDGTTLSVTETSPADSRQWKYSKVSGGPYDNVITGATSTSYTPKFSGQGSYYVVCVSVKNSQSYISNEVRINIPLFVEDAGISLPGLYYSNAKWGDYDADGDLDISLSGFTGNSIMSGIYRNQSGVFTSISSSIPALQYGSSAWADYDGDGDLDIIVTGYNNILGPVTKIFRNDAGTFTDLNLGLPGVQHSYVSWSDFDSDGDPDFVLMGYVNATTFITRIYRNDRTSFKDIQAPLDNLNRGFAEWGDYDNDGDPDLLLSGLDVNGSIITKIYRNNNGSFADINAVLPQLQRSSGAWGDYDSDGDLDIIITGNTGTGTDYISKIIRNDAGTFSEVNVTMPGLYASSVGWGDFDNDGDADLIMTGLSSSGATLRLLSNNNGSFTEINSGISPVYIGTVAWGDYDNDSDLDILITGYSISNITKVYRNTITTPNTPPLAPANTATIPVDLDKVLLQWSRPTDNTTAQNAITYNVRMGTTTGSNNIVASMSGSSGYRMVPVMGNAVYKYSSFPVKNLTAAVAYYWSVQAIDQSFAGGPWSAEKVFTLLAAPVAADPTIKSYTSFTASWTSSAGATGYLIDVATDAAFTSMVTGYNGKDVGNVTTLSVTGLTPLTTYYYRVRGYIPAVASLFNSNTASTTTLALTPPVAADPVVKSHTSFTASWTVTPGATGYIIDVATDASFTSMVTGYNGKDVGNVTTLAVTGLSPVTSYYYRVRGYLTGSFSANSNTSTTTTFPVPPPAPAGLTVKSCNDNVAITWNAITTPYTFRRYRIYAGTTANPTTQIDSTTLGNISETTKTISGLVHGQTYYFRVKGVIDPGVGGDISTQVSIKVQKGIVPQIKSKYQGGLLITYNKSDSITAYQWYNGATQLSGATKQFYSTSKVSGSYSVKTTDKNGCQNSSNIINVGSKSLAIYPNPATENFTLNLDCETTGKTVIRMYNSFGTRVLELKTDKTNQMFQKDIDISTLQSGIYSVEIIVDNEEKLDTRIVVIK